MHPQRRQHLLALNHHEFMTVPYSTNSMAAYKKVKFCSENVLQDDAHAWLLVCSLLTDV